MSLRQRALVVSVLKDQELIAAIARSDKHPEIRRVAITRVRDQAALADIARGTATWEGGVDWQVRRDAASRLEDQVALGEIARGETSSMLRHVAVERLEDKRALAVIARTDMAWQVRCAAVGRIEDEDVLTEILWREDNEIVRGVALERVKAHKGAEFTLLQKLLVWSGMWCTDRDGSQGRARCTSELGTPRVEMPLSVAQMGG